MIIYQSKKSLDGPGVVTIIYSHCPYAAVYPGASLMALKVVFPELLLPPLIFIVMLLLSSRYHSRVSPAEVQREIDLHYVVMPSPNVEMLYQAVKYHTCPPL